MKKLILFALICASFTLQAQTYKTVTMALDTIPNIAILRAGNQSLDLNAKFQSKLVSGTTIKTVNGTSLLGSGNIVISGADSTVYRTVANSLSLAQTQTALNLKAQDSSALHTRVNETKYSALTIGKATADRKIYGTIVGNSIVQGSLASATSQKWTTLLTDNLGFIEDNQGISGSTMQKGTPLNPLGGVNIVDRVSNIINRSALNGILIFSIGINDVGFNGSDYDTVKFKRDYRIVLNAVLASGYQASKILIVAPSLITTAGKSYYSTINGGNGAPSDARIAQYTTATQNIAIEYSLKYLDYKPSMIISIAQGNNLMATDGIHPNTLGHKFIYDFINDYIRGNGMAGTTFTVNGNQSINGSLEVTNKSNLGNSSIGQWPVSSTFARFGHKDFFNSATNYGFMQNNDGTNFIGGGSLSVGGFMTVQSSIVGGGASGVAKLDISDGNTTGLIAYIGSSNVNSSRGIYFSRPTSNSNPINIQGTQAGIGSSDFSIQAEGGNLGVGTSSPSQKIHIVGNSLVTGSSTSLSFIKSGGLSSQFLKGDGSVDATVYQPSLVSGTTIKTVNGTSLLGSGNFVIAGTDSTVFRTVLNSLSLAQAQTALNLKANLSGATFTGAVSGTSLTLSGAGTVGTILGVGTATSANFDINTARTSSGVFGAQNFSSLQSFYTANNTSAASTGTLGGGRFTSTIGATNTQNWSNGTAGLEGGFFNPTITSGSSGIISFVNGVRVFQNGFSSTGASITNLYGVRVSPITAGTITNFAGLTVEANARGTNNTYLLLGTQTIPAGNWGIYAQYASNNYLGTGNTLINTLTDNGVDKLQVTGSASISTNLQASNIGAGITPSASTRLLLAPATTSISSFRMPNGVAPTTPVSGDFWNLTTGLRTQTFDGTQTKDVLFDKANAVFADGIVGVAIIDGAGNIAKGVQADRTTSNTQTKTASYTVVLSDYGANGTLFIRADATAGAMTITLPTATVMAGLTITVKKVDATANTVTISAASIDGVATKVLSGLNVFTSITSNGTVFNIIGDKPIDATVAGTGWASYQDNVYTLASPLSIASGTTVTLTNNAATTISTQLPIGVTSLYNSATSKITPAAVGDGYGISIRFKAKSTSSSDFFDLGIDIGGAVGVISKQTRTFIKGANTEVAFDININAFSLTNFVANGGLIKLTAGNGTMTVYNIIFDVFRTHKAY